MKSKDIIIIVLKVVIYAAGLFLVGFGVNTLVSCDVVKHTVAVGKTTILTTDTTHIYHSLNVDYPSNK